MNKEQYTHIFEIALENASQNAEKAFQVEVPRQFQIELRGAGKPHRILSVDDATDDLFISEDLFWLLINVMVTEISRELNLTNIYMSITGHGPSSFEDTFHYFLGTGPFHQVLPMSLKTPELVPLISIPDDFIP